MVTLRKSSDRGLSRISWLHSQHTFSFAEYMDRQHMGFSVLRVINEDLIAGGAGFQTHPHRDMEIISVVVGGKLQHRDSMGNSTVIHPGEVQIMSAGTGIQHSEFNPDPDEQTHLLQIWILPDQTGLKPSYGQKDFSKLQEQKPLVLAVSKEGAEGSVVIHQDARLYLGRLQEGQTLTLPLKKARKGWVQIVRGTMNVNATTANDGDGLALTDIQDPEAKAITATEFLFFDLP